MSGHERSCPDNAVRAFRRFQKSYPDSLKVIDDMLLFYPQWQGAGPGKRIDRPARALMDALAVRLHGREALEIPLETSEALEREAGIWGRGAILRQLTDARDRLAEAAPERVFAVGGDCGIEVAVVGYLNQRHDDFALVWFDAHADLNTPETSPSATFHGMPLRVLFGEGDPDFTALVPKPLAPSQVVMVSVRDLDPAERGFIDERGIVNVAADVPYVGARLVTLLRSRGVRRIYIHFDLDALDPDRWPHMHYPTAGGFTVAEATEAVVALHDDFDVVGMSITEYDAPDGDGLDTLSPLLDLFTKAAAFD